jgi:hypothetical protein
MLEQNKMQAMHEMNSKIQKAQLVLTRLKGGALLTSYYIIQWNLLKDHQSFENFYQLRKPLKNLC